MNTVVKMRLFSGLNLPNNISPDIYELEEESIIQPKKDFVISCDSNGIAISLYGDNTWDLSVYSSSPKSFKKFHFEKNIPLTLIEESKKLLFIVMLFGKGRRGSSLATNTLGQNYFLPIVELSNHAYTINKSIKEVLSNKKLLTNFIFLTKNYKIVSFLYLLDKVDNKYTGIDYTKDDNLLRMLFLKKKKTLQTSLIPMNLLSESIHQRWLQFNEIKDASDLLYLFLKKYQKDVTFINNKDWDLEIKKSKWKKLLNIFNRYDIKSRRCIPKFIRMFQGTCKHLIHMYTGMRDSEASSLKINCFEEIFDKKSESVTIIFGETTKLEGFKKITKWITSSEIKVLINMLSEIAIIIASKHTSELNKLPLFISSQLLFTKKSEIKCSILEPCDQLPFLHPEKLRISVEDIEELEVIDYFRDWRNEEKFKIGNIWKFKPHQYRRSLAVYALQSGLVSIGALQLQLKHLFREMTLYYGNGAVRAKNYFDLPKNHIGMDFDDIKLEMDTLSYIKNVIFSDERLFGTHGKFIEKRFDENVHKLHLLKNREETMKKFRNGELAYTETALGACTSTEACDYRLTRSMYACINCESAVIKQSKIDNVIKSQEEFLSFLDKSSVEYRTEVEDLNLLKKCSEQFMKKDKNE